AYRPGPASSARPGNRRELERGASSFGTKILESDGSDVRDLMPGIEEGPYLPVVDACVGRMMNDRAHHHPHRARPHGQRASMWGVAGVLGTTPRVSSRSREAPAIRGRS